MHARGRESLELKMRSMVARHEQMKSAFTELKSQISIGLLEAEDVFASLAIPLMKLVGLKTMEMANEGRFTTIILNNHFHHHHRQKKNNNWNHDNNQEESPVAAKAAMATGIGKQLLGKQQTQFVQLLHLLKQIESKVNSRRNNLAETIADHRASLRSFFQRAIANLSNTTSDDDAIEIALNLLLLAFKNVTAVLGSVESGVEDLMDDLAQQMCDPMVEYVKGLRDDMKNGTCVRLLALVKEMERAIYDGRVQLEEAKNKQRAAEETKTDALNRLTESQQRVNKMKECLGLRSLSLAQAQSQHHINGSIQPVAAHKLLGKLEDQARDEKLLWELLERKRKNQAPESPMGPKELQFSEPKKKRNVMPLISPITRSLSSGQSPHTPHPDYRIPLGSSPSVAQQVSRRHITH